MFRLAWQCGYVHPRPMLETIDAIEYGELLDVLSVEPLPDVRADLRAARAAWASFQPHVRRRLKESDFLFRFGPKAAPAVRAKELIARTNQRYGMMAAAFDRQAKRNG